MGFPGGSDGKESICNASVQSLGWEDPLQKGIGNQLQYSGLENPMDRGACWATVYGVTKTQTQLSMHGRKRSEKQRTKGKIHPTACRVPENSKER